MIVPALVSALHVLSLGVGLPAVFLRGRALRRLGDGAIGSDDVLSADDAWGRPLDLGGVATLRRHDDAEVALILAIPLAAALMARGVWLFAW